MTHRPETLFTYKLAIAMRRGSKGKPGMKWAAVAIALNMSEQALKQMLYRVGKDRRRKPRPGSTDRRQSNVAYLSTDENPEAA